MQEFFKKLISEKDTEHSSQRFTLLISSLISNILVFGVWTAICFKKGEMVTIPDGVFILYGIANGVTMLGKVFQKKIEVSNGNGNPTSKEVILTPTTSRVTKTK